jgi:predicted phage-related endonuclease
MVGKVTPDDMASASLLPSILGINKYASPNDALLGCIDAIEGRPRPDIGNEAMAWGNTMEPIILKEAALRLGLDNLDLSHNRPYFHQFWRLACSLDATALGRGQRIEHDPEHGICVLGANSITLDGLGVLEAKLTGSNVEDQPPLWRGPVQLQAQMAITGSTWGAVATLYRGVEMKIYLFDPHEVTLKAIEQAVADFERRLTVYRESKTIDYYPPADSADANRTWAVADEDADPLWLPAADENLILDLQIEKDKIKAAENRIDELEKALKEKLKEAPCARVGSYEIRWPMRHYKAQPERIVPATQARSVRQSTLTIKEAKK